MGDAGRHFADRGQALLQPSVALEPPHVSDILEGEQESGSPVRKRQRTDRQTEVDRPPVAGAMLGVDLERATFTETRQPRARIGRQLQHLDRVVPDRLSAGETRESRTRRG